ASASNKKTKGLHKSVVKQALPPKPSKYPVLFPIAEKVPKNLSASHTRIDKKHNTCSVNLTMVGDSITEGAKPYLLQVMPNAYIDGKVSRQIFHGADEYAQDISSKHAGDVVIYALGTNGPPHDDSVLQHMVDVAKGKPVYFVTTRVPQPWQDVTNDRLRKFAQTHPNVGIIDWNGFSKDHSEYLTDDGVHLTPVGGPKYAKMIRLALCGA
ncbi:acyltransferase, partial [Bifidobacteriaceae bacterium WP012]